MGAKGVAFAMRVDGRTLADLGVLPEGEFDWPMSRLLNHTHSPAAFTSLKKLLREPLAARDEIVRRQVALRALHDVARRVDWTELTALMRDLEGFLNSNYIHFPRMVIEGAAFRLRHRNVVEYIEPHLRMTRALLLRAEALTKALAEIQGDAQITEMMETLRRITESPLMHTMREATASGPVEGIRLCTLDQVVRVDNRVVLRDLHSALATFDAFASLASAANQLEWRFAAISEQHESAVAISGLRHPLLRIGVPSDVQFAPGERVMFVTGPNMAGKSTLLRALGLAVYFTHIGLPVAADAARIPITDVLISSINVQDSIALGVSLYLAEVRRVKAVVAEVTTGKSVMALLDELFRGTNVKDAVDATNLLVSGLASAHHGLFVIASHLVEVADHNAARPHVGTWCMRTDDDVHGPLFAYTLQRGISRVRIGVALLEAEGVAAMLRALEVEGNGDGPPSSSIAHQLKILSSNRLQ